MELTRPSPSSEVGPDGAEPGTVSEGSTQPAEAATRRRFRQCESYLHRYAKDVLASWFMEQNRAGRYYVFDWRPGQCRVPMEYPILSRVVRSADGGPPQKEYFGVDPAWDRLPDLEKAAERGLRLEAVLDLGLCLDGQLVAALEVVNTHACTPQKVSLLQKLGVACYELDALWIMSQIRRPPKLSMKRLWPAARLSDSASEPARPEPAPETGETNPGVIPGTPLASEKQAPKTES